MKTPQRNFVVEYKTNRRQTQAKPPSIWGSLDLQAVARQIEADGILPNAAHSDPNATEKNQALSAAIAASQEPHAAIEDHLHAPDGSILGDGDGTSLKDLARERPAVGAPAVHDDRRTAGDAMRPNRSPRCSKRAPVQERTAAEDCFEVSRPRDNEEDVVALDAENRRLKRLVIVKLRQENNKLRSMLSRFGAE